MNLILAAFINGGLMGALIVWAVAETAAIVSRRALNAATRYAVWWAAMIVVVALPLFYLPRHAAEPVSAVPSFAPATPREIPAAPETPRPPVVAEGSRGSGWPQFPFEVSAGKWPSRLVALWGIVALLMIGRLCASYIVMERRRRRARPAERLRDWPVRALLSSDISSPMAAGLFRPAILIPERLLAELGDDDLDQIRIHETAHFQRRDDIALLIQRAIEAIFALHPVVRWIGRRIDLEREIACDDFVVEQTGRAAPYASCLTRVVEFAGGVRSSPVAAAAAEGHSHLAKRIEVLLDKTREKGTRLLKTPLAVMIVGLVALTAATTKLPGLIVFAAQESDEAPAAPQSSASESRRDSSTTWRTNDGLHSREMRLRGDVQFNDTDSDVKAMSPGSYFSYEESFGFSGRRYEATPGAAGQVNRRFFVEGREKPFDADAQGWLRAALPDIVRESGINAPERVRRILKQRGTNAVLAEIAKINSDGTRRLYIKELVPIGNLNADQFQTVLRLVRNIGSDGEKASLLIFLEPYTLKDNLRDYTFEAIKTISSDGEKHRVLTQVILHDPSRGTLPFAARAAAGISSDGEKAAVLLDLTPHLRGDRDLAGPFFRAADTISSDGERARVLIAAVGSAGDQHDTLADALRSARSISSDGEKASVLIHAAAYWQEDDVVRAAYFESADSISSDGEKARVLTAITARGGLSDRTLIDEIHSAMRISSDGEKSRVLLAIVKQAGAKANVREEVKAAAKSISSDGEYRRVMAAIE